MSINPHTGKVRPTSRPPGLRPVRDEIAFRAAPIISQPGYVAITIEVGGKSYTSAIPADTGRTLRDMIDVACDAADPPWVPAADNEDLLAQAIEAMNG